MKKTRNFPGGGGCGFCISGLELETSVEDCIGVISAVGDDAVSGKQVLV